MVYINNVCSFLVPAHLFFYLQSGLPVIGLLLEPDAAHEHNETICYNVLETKGLAIVTVSSTCFHF